MAPALLFMRGLVPPPATLPSLLPPVPRDSENEHNQLMWMRFRHEYNMLSLGLRDGLSDIVLAWLIRVLDDWVERWLRALGPEENDTII